ncbi:MAG: 2-C-methyl-D-erythritol 4-phosphate cytidylyltransferase [Porticoccaceae bacterium]|nr:2-C-methyl-D-erythritol 4-phosphate cytidylyltransferase [Porticoccaceae bacterium]
MKYWLIVPAAGLGRRFGGDVPKQYLSLAGRPVLERTLERLLMVDAEEIVVALNPDDTRWPRLTCSDHPRIRTVAGGSERADSVRAALRLLADRAAPDDWVLVHDAARPCVTASDILGLMRAVTDNPVGGILAAPVSDTLKRADGDGLIAGTQPRESLWAAMTPQMFRYGLLVEGLENLARQGISGTDESAAVESLGLKPLAVAGRRDNIKITVAEDLAIAAAILSYQEGEV